jgi:NitT/TauT family transport system substrate-binding protein
VLTSKWASIIGVASALALIGGCGDDGETGSSGSADNSPQHATFLLNFVPGGSEAAFYYGQKLGIYEEEGIDLDIQPGKTSATTIQQVASDRADIGTAAVKDILVAANKGIDSVSVGSRYGESSTGLLVPTDSDIHTLKDLEGKTVVRADSAISDVLGALMRQHGADPSKVHFVTVSPAVLTSTYISGKVDAYLGNVASSASVANAERPSRQIRLAEQGLKVPDYTFFVSAGTLKERPDLIRRFLKATYRAIVAANENPKAAAEAEAGELTGSDAERLQGQYTNYMRFMCNADQKGRSIGYMAPDAWKGGAKQFADVGLVDADLVEKVETLFTNEFVDGPEAVVTTTCPVTP